MSDENKSPQNQQTLVIALAAVAVVLLVVVGVVIWQQTQSSNTATLPSPTTTTGQTGAAGGATGGTSGGAAAGSAASAAFDAKTATKLAAGQTPQQALETYNKDVIDGKFAEAYKLLPTDKQQSYGTPDAYASQVKGYGITSYKVGKPTVNGDETVIVSEQVTPQMPITYTWTFKKVGDTWYVQSRVMGGQIN
jgi:hypothetical protein